MYIIGVNNNSCTEMNPMLQIRFIIGLFREIILPLNIIKYSNVYLIAINSYSVKKINCAIPSVAFNDPKQIN